MAKTSQKLSSSRTTLTEVARRAGVSLTTASLVMGGKAEAHRISHEVLDRVQCAVKEMDYVPNRLVHSMQSGRTQILSFFNGFRDRSVHDIYMDTLSTAIQRAAGRYGYDVLVNCDFSRSPGDTYRHLHGGIVDGVLFFAPLPCDPLLPFLRDSRLPALLINAHDEQGVLPGVKDDMSTGIDLVTQRLYELGHRRIAIFTDANQQNDSEARTLRMRANLAKKGVKIPDEWVISFTGEMLPAIETLMSQNNPPTAIFCWRDRVAYWTLEICEKLGIIVPASLSIVGYDGLDWPAATHHTPASVKVDMDQLADTAIKLLIQYINEPGKPILQDSIPVTMLEGTTLAKAGI